MHRTEIQIRHIQPDDAQAYATLLHHLDQETRFLLFEPDERQTTVAELRASIQQMHLHNHSTIFVAEDGNELVGFLEANGNTARRLRHALYLVVGIRQGYVGRGIGTQLFVALEAWARLRHIHRLHLTVMTHNERALSLYKKMGFLIEGLHRHAMGMDGECGKKEYVDEYTMAKLLDVTDASA